VARRLPTYACKLAGFKGSDPIMSVVTDPRAAPWRRLPFAAAAALALLLFLGVSLAAVAEIKVECANDYLLGDGQILTADDNQTRMVAGPPQYWVSVGDVQYPLPLWAHPILSKFGWLPTEVECR
jgi:hypothetical protein